MGTILTIQFAQFGFLFFIWHLYWYFYNFVLLKNKLSTERTPILVTILNIFSSLVAVIVIQGKLDQDTLLYLTAITLLSCVLYILGFHRESGRFMNSLWQQTWFFSIAKVGVSSVPILSAIFVVVHLGILLVDHLELKAKLTILALTIPGGIMFSIILLTLPAPFSIISTIILHSLAYIVGFRTIERQYHLEIIN